MIIQWLVKHRSDLGHVVIQELARRFVTVIFCALREGDGDDDIDEYNVIKRGLINLDQFLLVIFWFFFSRLFFIWLFFVNRFSAGPQQTFIFWLLVSLKSFCKKLVLHRA